MDVTARAELSLPPPSDKTSPAGNMVCYLQVQEVSCLSLVLFVTSFSTSTQVCARARGRGVGCDAPSSALHLVLLPGVFCPFLDKQAKAEACFWFLLSFSLPPPHPVPPPFETPSVPLTQHLHGARPRQWALCSVVCACCSPSPNSHAHGAGAVCFVHCCVPSTELATLCALGVELWGESVPSLGGSFVLSSMR